MKITLWYPFEPFENHPTFELHLEPIQNFDPPSFPTMRKLAFRFFPVKFVRLSHDPDIENGHLHQLLIIQYLSTL